MDQQPHASPDAPPPSQSNDLPEAHDPTTEKIHSLSNFHVSEALGLPLLTKDVGKTGSTTERKPETGRKLSGMADDPGPGLFAYYSAQDRLMAAAVCAVILGPLFFGALRG